MAPTCDSIPTKRQAARKVWLRAALISTLPTAAVIGTAAVSFQSTHKPDTQSKPKAEAKTSILTNSAIRNPKSAIASSAIIPISGPWEKTYDLTAGKTVEISVHLEKPSTLPANGRLAVEWGLSSTTQRPNDPTTPGPGFRKVLHALDGDIYQIYRAPAAGKYTLKLRPVVDEEPIGDASPRWREKGHAPGVAPLPRVTPWPAGTVAPVSVAVKAVNTGSQAEQDKLHTIIETEPNDSADYAQPITLTSGEDIRTWEVTGGADDAEYFDNGKVGKSGDDWFRVEYKGTKPCLMTAQLSMPGQAVAARVRCYKLGEAEKGAKPDTDIPQSKVRVAEYSGRINPARTYYNENKVVPIEEGRDPNERVHQQDEQHRTNINRMLYPGETYFLRVEANSPGYQLQLRTLPPGPYTDPRMAIKQGMYLQIGQVDAWLSNRPRGASIERRIRDSGNMLGTACMSCHTHSGVWGPSGPIAAGYALENPQSFWHLQNLMYECLRPTNELKDAANNTSLAPLDIGDGPAGTRAAGFNIVSAERILAPKKLHSKMQIRTANFVLQTADPGGINAAGPGSNFGFVIVNTFAAEILETAWEKTEDPKYFRALQKKAQQVLAVDPKVTDDLGLRLDFFGRVLPMKDYIAWAGKAQAAETAKGLKAGEGTEEATKFAEKVAAQLKIDEARLRAIQNTDGTWSFNQGKTTDGGKTWVRGDEPGDPSPTALGIWGLSSIGCGKDDPAVSKAVQALLKMQEPTGRWNRAAITGFVTCAYSMQALARLYPTAPVVYKRQDYVAKPGESLLATVDRVRRLALTGEPKFADLMIQAAKHESPVVRYWTMIGLGATHTAQGAPVALAGLSDKTKIVREAATWATHQTLLDDNGWAAALAAAQTADDYTRQGVWQALNMRADAVMPKARLNWAKLDTLFDYGMNHDPHPAVRAYASKAAWQWWVWNPPVRTAVNKAWIAMLERPESSALVEHNNRYATQALFIVNGHKANGSKEHQYKELATLFETLDKEFDKLDSATKDRMARRLVAVSGTFYQTSGGDGGPGQMGYVTPYASDVMGRAALAYLQSETKKTDVQAIEIGLEGAANIPNRELTEFLVSYSLKGPDNLRQLAASAISDPRVVSLAAVPEQVEPQFAQIRRGAMDAPRRPQISEPIIELWSKVNWTIPKTEEQQSNFFNIVIPKLDQYTSPAQVASMSDTAKRAETEREMSANWYLADRLGDVLASNPDLHQEIVLLKYFPDKITNPLQAHYWLKSVGWLLTYKGAAEKMSKSLASGSLGREVVGSLGGASGSTVRTVALQTPTQRPNDPATQRPTKPDPILSIKDKALQLYLDMLKPDADPKTRAVAIRMSGQTAFKTNPEVLRALAEWLPNEKDATLKKAIENVLNSGSEKFMPDLTAVLKTEKHASVAFDAKGEPQLTKTQLDDIIYFRDYVMPEMSRQKRQDQQSCMGCHGLQGRVPSLYLKAPDEYGYLAVGDLVSNYRTLQGKVNMADLERSKILRKPLNIQDGKEDGHQGGRRYAPTDEGYLILKTWVGHQPEIQKSTLKSANHSAGAAAGFVLPFIPGIAKRKRRKA